MDGGGSSLMRGQAWPGWRKGSRRLPGGMVGHSYSSHSYSSHSYSSHSYSSHSYSNVLDIPIRGNTLLLRSRKQIVAS